jgi:hypothetical protein
MEYIVLEDLEDKNLNTDSTLIRNAVDRMNMYLINTYEFNEEECVDISTIDYKALFMFEIVNVSLLLIKIVKENEFIYYYKLL